MGSSSSCCEKSGRLEAAAEVAAPKAAEKEKEPECCHKATEMDVAPMWSADLEGLRFDHLKAGISLCVRKGRVPTLSFEAPCLALVLRNSRLESAPSKGFVGFDMWACPFVDGTSDCWVL